MRPRREHLSLTIIGIAGAVMAACRQEAQVSNAPAQKQDVKTLAASLQTKVTALIDAMNARNDQRITAAKTDLEKEANRVEDALKSETGAAANRVNAAINRIRPAMISNDVNQLTSARDLLQQAQQQS
ncbi:MAG TPA: hypothetical protein VFX49_00705 [Chloroflexota bacterium]|nr:hypothetical protein [Chloroflexota bacterium]